MLTPTEGRVAEVGGRCRCLLDGVVDDVVFAVGVQCRLPGGGVHDEGGAEESEFLSQDVPGHVFDAALEVVVACFGVVACAIQVGERDWPNRTTNGQKAR